MRHGVLVLAFAGCISHARLDPPPLGATAAERIAAYQRLSPRGFGSFQNAHANDIGFLVLGDGQRVYFAEDLIPVVPPGSPTAIAGARHRGAWDRAWHWLKVGGIGYAAAIAIPLVALGTMKDDDARTEVMIGGAALGTTIGTIGMVGAAINAVESNGERASVFLTYDDALRAELHLCIAGLEVYDCASGPALAHGAAASIPGVATDPR